LKGKIQPWSVAFGHLQALLPGEEDVLVDYITRADAFPLTVSFVLKLAKLRAI
jgi:hypothetical protein